MAPWDSRLMVAHPQLYRVIRHIIKGMKLLPPDPTQDSPTGFRFILDISTLAHPIR